MVSPHKIEIARTLACFVASPLATRGDNEGKGIGQLMGFLESTFLSLTGERHPSLHSMLRFPAILKNTPVTPEG